MAILKIFATKSLNQVAVFNSPFNLLIKAVKDMILLTLLQLHLCHEIFIVEELDALHNLGGILVLKVVIVPLFGLLLEVVTVGPKLVAFIKISFEDFDFSNLDSFLNFQDLFVLLVLSDFVCLELELLPDLIELSKSLLRLYIGVGQNFTVQVFDLLSDQ